MMRVVLDTNVLLSAVLGRALAPILEAWIAGRFVLIISNAIMREYVDVLSRPKLGLPPSVTDAIVSYLLHRAEFVTPAASAGVIARDPSDDVFLDAAAVGQAAYIVSGDRHLLEQGRFQNIPIITARLPGFARRSRPERVGLPTHTPPLKSHCRAPRAAL